MEYKVITMKETPRARKRGQILIFSVLVAVLPAFVGAVVITESNGLLDYDSFFLTRFFILTIPALIVGFLFALLGMVIANRAEKSGRSWMAFFWLSGLVSPLVMGIIAVTLKPLDSPNGLSTGVEPKSDKSLESQLVGLQNLKDTGILSEEEFSAAKKKALDL